MVTSTGTEAPQQGKDIMIKLCNEEAFNMFKELVNGVHTNVCYWDPDHKRLAASRAGYGEAVFGQYGQDFPKYQKIFIEIKRMLSTQKPNRTKILDYIEHGVQSLTRQKIDSCMGGLKGLKWESVIDKGTCTSKDGCCN